MHVKAKSLPRKAYLFLFRVSPENAELGGVKKRAQAMAEYPTLAPNAKTNQPATVAQA